MRSPSWSIPIASRPSHLPLLHAISFAVLFNSLILLLFFLLVLFLPLRLCTPRLGVWHSRLGKRLFGASLVVVSRLFFGDLEYVISSEGEGDTDNWVERDAEGRVIKVNVPKRSIWISNHQTLADWLFLWTFFYLTDSSPSLYIALKSSLEKIPIIGTACNWFGFAFLERNWGKDKVNFERQLEGMSNDCHLLGREGKEEEGELSFLLFPEGTIVTENTRGISTKFAEKSNLKDLKYTLLPRSTGLFFALRQLAIRVPSLRLVDLNVGYPLPRHSLSSSAERKPLYPSEYYSLPSIFLYRVPPPELHFHLRTFELKDIPLGDLTRLKEEGKGEGDDGTEEERKEFEEWLRRRWEEKDDLLKRFNETGSFVERQTRRTEEDEDEDEDRVKGEVAWRPRLRSPVSETLQFVGIIVIISIAFGWGLPFVWQTVKTSLRSTASPSVQAGCGCGKMGGDVMRGVGIDRIDL